MKLADVRRGQYEGLKTEIAFNTAANPTSGPRLHPSAGAVAVGARPFLIAYNINLDSDDIDLAKRIARRVRESGGGLPKVQANGFWIEELGRRPGLDEPARLRGHAALARLGHGPRRRRRGRHRARRSELIGLAPLAAFLAVADRAEAPSEDPIERRSRRRRLPRLRDFSPLQALELRLEAAQAGRPADR